MIDFIKVAYSGPLTLEFYEKHKNDFQTLVNPASGELKSDWFYTKRGSLKIAVYLNVDQVSCPGGRILIKGSLHKNYHHGANYQRFDWFMLQEEIFLLTQYLGIPGDQLRIQQLEFGLNIEIWEPPLQYLSKRLVSLAGQRFLAYLPDKQGRSLGFYSGKTMILKCYDKGLQYDLEDQLLRIEMRILRSQTLKRMGIVYLSDLSSQEKLQILGKHFLNLWNSALLHDDMALQLYLKDTGNNNDFEGAHSYDKWEEWRREMSTAGYHKKMQRYRRIIRDFDQKMGIYINDLLAEELDICLHRKGAST